MINMVFEKFQQERDRQVMRLTTRVIKMLSNGIELEKIAKETGIQIDKFINKSCVISFILVSMDFCF